MLAVPFTPHYVEAMPPCVYSAAAISLTLRPAGRQCRDNCLSRGSFIGFPAAGFSGVISKVTAVR